MPLKILIPGIALKTDIILPPKLNYATIYLLNKFVSTPVIYLYW
jgi:hypothetical protein